MKEIIYLDKEFIIKEHEKTHKQAPVKYTKTTIVQAGINFGASIGGTLRESFEYDLKIEDMWIKAKKKLKNNYPTIILTELNNNQTADIFWVDGILGISKNTTRLGGKTVDSYYTYVISQEECGCDNQLDVIVDSSYLVSGYSQLLSSGNSKINGFKIKAKMLMKTLGTVEKNKYLLTPLVIEKTGYYFIEEN